MNIIISTKHLFKTWGEKIAHAYANEITNLSVDKDELKDIDVKDLGKTLNDHKMVIYLYDPKLPSVSITNEVELKLDLENFDKLLLDIEGLPVVNIVYRIPFFSNVVEDYNLVASHLKNIIAKFKKTKLTLLVKPEDRLANSYTYIIKKFNNKQLRLLFDPVFFNKKEALGTAYRQLYDVIDVFSLNDVNQRNEVTLASTGIIKMEQLLNRVVRDNQNYMYLLNPTYNDYFKQEEKQTFLQKLFDFEGVKVRKTVKRFALQINPQDNKNITIGDVYQHDIKILKRHKLLI